jgi:ABC-type phosphate transport system substrate-binding protein
MTPRLLRILLPLALGLSGAQHVLADAPAVVVIAHPAVAVTSLPRADVRAFLLGTNTNWPSGGGAVRLAVLTSGPAHEAAMADIVGRTPAQFDNHWKRLVFTGGGAMPHLGRNEAEVVAYVASTPGALGYVGPAALTDAVKRIDVTP